MVRNDRYKLVVAHGTDGGELYDLIENPQETHNLWDHSDYKDVKLEMQERAYPSDGVDSGSAT